MCLHFSGSWDYVLYLVVPHVFAGNCVFGYAYSVLHVHMYGLAYKEVYFSVAGVRKKINVKLNGY